MFAFVLGGRLAGYGGCIYITGALSRKKWKNENKELSFTILCTFEKLTKKLSNISYINNGHFLSCSSRRFQSEAKWWRLIFIILVSTRKVLHLVSFWKWEFLELGDCLSITHLLQDNLKKGTQIGTKKNSHTCYVFISLIILISMFWFPKV